MKFIETFNKLKDFNSEQLAIEVETLGLPEHDVWFAGFAPAPNGRSIPAEPTSPRMVVIKSKIPGQPPVTSVAVLGDIRYASNTEFTAQQLVDLEAKLDAHDAQADSPLQAARAQKQADTVALEVAIAGGVSASDLPLIARLLLALAQEE